MRLVSVSSALKSTLPSPVMVPTEHAPLFPHPFAVLSMVLPSAVTPTKSVHSTPVGIVVVVEDVVDVVELVDVVEIVVVVVEEGGIVIVVVELVGDVVEVVKMPVVEVVVVVGGPVPVNSASAIVPPLVSIAASIRRSPLLGRVLV